MIDTQSLLKELMPMAREAGQRIMDVFTSDHMDVQQKRDWSPVTRADLEANAYLTAALQSLDKAIPIVSEEDPAQSFAERQSWEYHWLVDPVDGTREFIDKNPDFSTNIALVHHGQAILGLVYAPATNICYYASSGQGAFKIDANGNCAAIHTRKLEDELVVVLGSRSHGSDVINEFVRKLGQHSLIKMGSALKSCLIAEGKADVYPRFGPTSEWDTAAAQIIVEEAGGAMTGLDMKPLRYNQRDSLINPYFLCVGDPAHRWQAYLPEIS